VSDLQVNPTVTVGNEPTVYGLMGAPFGDLEFDVGKSARWLEYFTDKMFVLDVNLGDPRYWIVNWAITFPHAEHSVTRINYFYDPVKFRKEQFAQADAKYHIADSAWVLFVDASEGISFDNASLPNDYQFNPFKSFIYREITRAEGLAATSVVLPFFVFLRSAEVQNVTYDHPANFEDGTFSLLQPISVPYYLPSQGLRRLIRADQLRNPAFDWASIDTLSAPSANVKAQIISYAYAHWNLQDVQPGQTEPPKLSEANDDGFRMRTKISAIRPIPGLPLDWYQPDPAGVPGPWAYYITINTHQSFVPITNSPVTPPNAAAAGVMTPLYDCVIRLNMRDGVWYEGDVSGNTPMTWDALNGKWQTYYDPNTWADLGVHSGDNPQMVEQYSPVPPTPA
jgi:hypothetical protein